GFGDIQSTNRRQPNGVPTVNQEADLFFQQLPEMRHEVIQLFLKCPLSVLLAATIRYRVHDDAVIPVVEQYLPLYELETILVDPPDIFEMIELHVQIRPVETWPRSIAVDHFRACRPRHNGGGSCIRKEVKDFGLLKFPAFSGIINEIPVAA